MWSDVKLSDLFRIGSSKRVLKSQWQSEGVPFYRGREVTRLSKDGFVDNELFISEELYREYFDKYGVPKAGDIIITAIGTIGNSYIVRDGDRFYFKDASVLWLDKISDVSSEFINYWLKCPLMKDQLDKGNGATVDTLTIKKLQSLHVHLPPIKEQKRIVAILDEAFAGIDTAIANTEKNLANARELFESYLNEVFAKKRDGWEDIKLGAACVVERGSSPRPIKAYLTDDEDGVNWVKIGDTKGITKYIETTKQKITKEGALRSRRVEPGDFILTNSMSYGRPYIMATTGYIHDGWFVLRLKEHINPDYFYHLLSSRLVQEQFGVLAAGAVVKNISSDLVKKAILPIPPMEQQVEIVAEIEMLSEQVQQLESIYERKLETLNELKQSLLQKAFSGELTAEKANTLKEVKP